MPMAGEPPFRVSTRAFASSCRAQIKSGSHRFTLVTPGRELKLRAPSADYLAWAAALAPIVGEIAPGRGGADDDDDD